MQRHATLHFFGPDGRRSDFRPSRWLPAPLHLLPALLGLRYLSLGEKAALARAILRLVRTPPTDQAGAPTVHEWLLAQRQPARVIERFWQVVLVSALGESLDRASLAAARKVLLDGFLAHREASHVLVPTVSLGELYDQRVAAWLSQRGVQIRLETPVEQVTASGIRLADGSHERCDFVILAAPWRKAAGMLATELLEQIPALKEVEAFAAAPITSVHLWFDRPLTRLPHAVLVGRLSQWVFARNQLEQGQHYYQVVISASHDLAGRERQAVVEEVLADLAGVFPETKDARLLAMATGDGA